MCTSAVVETESDRIPRAIGVSRLPDCGNEALVRRLETKSRAYVAVPGRQGLVTSAVMAFNPYVLSVTNLAGDMWASSLLGANHGLIVMKSFSEWINARLLVNHGIINAHEIHCAFNRVLVAQKSPDSEAARFLLSNFAASAPMLVPVLFDRSRTAESGAASIQEFVVLTRPAPDLAPLGISNSPVALSREAALEWLHPHDHDLTAPYFEDLLHDEQNMEYQFSLYKSA